MNENNNRIIWIFTFGVFGILNTEMGIVGILPMIAEKFSVSIATAGWLISGFALVVAFAGPTMPLLCSKINRKTLMLISGGIFIISNITAAFAPNFIVLIIARIIPAVFHPAYVSIALTEAGKAVKPEESAKAVSKVFIGVSAGMVLGVPLTNLIATQFSFTIAMLFFAVVNAIAFILTGLFIPSMPATIKTISYRKQLGILKNPSMLLSIIIVIFLNGAIFGFYSYISDFMEKITKIDVTTISLFLMFYGVANIVGNIIAGRILTINAKTSTYILPFILIVAYTMLFMAGNLTIATAVCVVIIGALAGINSNINQYLITEAGAEAPEFSNGLYLTFANLGTTLGTFICGLFITAMNTRYSLFGTLIFIAIGFAAIVLKINMEKANTQRNKGGNKL